MQLQKLDFVSGGTVEAPGDAFVSPTPAPAVPANEGAPSQPRQQEIEAAVVAANKAVRSLAATLEFAVDADTDTIVIRLVDNSDHTVLRQVPSEEMLKIAKAIDRIQGLLLRQEA